MIGLIVCMMIELVDLRVVQNLKLGVALIVIGYIALL